MKDNNMSNIFSDDDRQYLQMMQDNIARMANNSANCKTWMVTIVAGLCAIGCSIKDMNGWIFLAIIPVVVFWYLDTFYLKKKKKMRNRAVKNAGSHIFFCWFLTFFAAHFLVFFFTW